jgi:hypothetical protein
MSYNFNTLYDLSYEIDLAQPARFDPEGVLKTQMQDGLRTYPIKMRRCVQRCGFMSPPTPIGQAGAVISPRPRAA